MCTLPHFTNFRYYFFTNILTKSRMIFPISLISLESTSVVLDPSGLRVTLISREFLDTKSESLLICSVYLC